MINRSIMEDAKELVDDIYYYCLECGLIFHECACPHIGQHPYNEYDKELE